MNEENKKQETKKIKFRSAESGHEGGGEEHYKGFEAGANEPEPITHHKSSKKKDFRSDSGHIGGGKLYSKEFGTAANEPKNSKLKQLKKDL